MMLKINAILLVSLFALTMSKNGDEKMTTKRNLPDAPVIDGPYVLYRGDSIFVNYIQGDTVNGTVKSEGMKAAGRDDITLHINTDIPGKTFDVKLKPKLTNEKAESKKVSKMLILSDIEGNFAAFRKLLRASNVIDDNFNWTFGNGDLVLIGDFVDRGNMVMEVLW